MAIYSVIYYYIFNYISTIIVFLIDEINVNENNTYG